MTRWLPFSWAVVLTVLLLGPALAPGYVLVRDMVWMPDLPLRLDTFGLGSGLPRAVPSDAVVAALDELVPGMLLQKLVLVGSLVGAGMGASALVRHGLVARLVAVSVAIWNPFVVERLAIGHWPVLLGYAAVPWLAVAGRRIASGRSIPAWTPLVLVIGSLSASAGMVSAAVLLVTALAGGVRRGAAVLLTVMTLAANAPWIAAGLTHADLAGAAGGFRAFATAGDGLPAPLAVITMGGIWNSDVVPASREGLWAWVGLVVWLALAWIGARRWWTTSGRRQGPALLALWCIGVGLAVTSWAAPGLLAGVGEHVPGVGLLRDGSRSLALALPLTVSVVAVGAETLVLSVRTRAGRCSLIVAAVLLPLAVLPDVAWGDGGDVEDLSRPGGVAVGRGDHPTRLGRRRPPSARELSRASLERGQAGRRPAREDAAGRRDPGRRSHRRVRHGARGGSAGPARTRGPRRVDPRGTRRGIAQPRCPLGGGGEGRRAVARSRGRRGPRRRAAARRPASGARRPQPDHDV